jgi:hypothetical protein
MAIEIVCPGCSSRLSVADTAAGKTARCPQCEGLMTVPALVEGSLVIAPPQLPPTDRPSKSRRQQEDDRPRRRRYQDEEVDDRPRRKKRRTGSPVGVIFGILGGLLLLAAVGVAIYFAVRSPDNETAGGGPGGAGRPAVRGAPPPGWIDFQPPDRSYRVFAPGALIGGTNTHQKGGRLFTTSLYEYTPNIPGKTGCHLVTTEFPADLPAGEREQLRQELESVGSLGTQPTTRRNVTWAGQPALEIECERGNARPRPPTGQPVPGAVNNPQRVYMVLRVLLTDRRCYIFALVRLGEPPPPVDCQAFFDSFDPN